jgi:hypothetical protein
MSEPPPPTEPLIPPGRAPVKQSIDYVAWRLGHEPTSFCGQLLQLVPHADEYNRMRLRLAFPRIVMAWDAWIASPDGDFDVTDLPAPEGVSVLAINLLTKGLDVVMVDENLTIEALRRQLGASSEQT